MPEECGHNAHLYYVLLDKVFERDKILDKLRENNIGAAFHFVPLHNSPAGSRLGRTNEYMKVTEKRARQLIRLPLWLGLTLGEQERVAKTLEKIIC